MAVLLLRWPSPPLLVNWPVSCHIPHAFDSVLGDTVTPPPQPWHTHGCAVLEELPYLSHFSGLQRHSHGVTSIKGSNTKRAKNRTDRQMRMKWSVAASCNPPLIGVVVLIAYHFQLLPVSPFAHQKVKLIHSNYFIVPQFLEGTALLSSLLLEKE